MRIPRNKRVDMAAPENQPKLFHAGDEWLGDTHPYVLVSEEGIRLAGSLNYGIAIDPQFGTLLQGKLSLSEAPESISFCGGYYRLNSMVLSGVASSAAMLVPAARLVPPQVRLPGGIHPRPRGRGDGDLHRAHNAGSHLRGAAVNAARKKKV